MRRALVFLLLGPLAVAIAATIAILPPGRVDAGIVWTTGALVFLMTLPISAVVGVIDSCLARRISVALRPGLTAAAGATIPCVGLIAFAHAAPVPSFLLPFAICGAASAGLCALYADGLGLRRLQPANPVNP
ncbi:MAG: hypothetical protein AB7I42_18050 [Bradyrhizobium sp.]|uniref:hypothetical protein n=1 Tax=Bradyrhizobium sp. TaxID=376 RepID=UPI00354665F0